MEVAKNSILEEGMYANLQVVQVLSAAQDGSSLEKSVQLRYVKAILPVKKMRSVSGQMNVAVVTDTLVPTVKQSVQDSSGVQTVKKSVPATLMDNVMM